MVFGNGILESPSRCSLGSISIVLSDTNKSTLKPRARAPSVDCINSDMANCNMCTCSGNGTQERAVQDLLCLVDLYLVYLI